MATGASAVGSAAATEKSPHTRVIIYTGKGGVGKSTIASATAVQAAQQGNRTLLMSVDSAHNLSDIFQTPLEAKPRNLAPRLDALEVNVNDEIRENWAAVIDFFRNLTFSSSLANQVVAEECAILPGMEEVFGLMRLRRLADSGAYDVIVVDSPPTGDMMKILRMPDVLEWFMKTYYPLEKRIAQSMRPLISRMTGVPVPGEEYFDNVEDTYRQVQRVSRLLMDHKQSSLRLVLTPDTISLQEAKRAYTGVSLFGFNVDAIILNKVLPARVNDPFFVRWLDTQRKVLDESAHAFEELPRLQAPYEDSEPLGLSRLQAFAASLYGDRRVSDVWVETPALQLEAVGDGLELRLRLPFLQKGQFDLYVKNNVLLVSVNTNRRQIPLPRSFEGRKMEKAWYENPTLIVRFK